LVPDDGTEERLLFAPAESPGLPRKQSGLEVVAGKLRAQLLLSP
jgi:hypothetical protein